ncbi:galactokinase [Salidesulfovibrio brasiliensis]
MNTTAQYRKALEAGRLDDQLVVMHGTSWLDSSYARIASLLDGMERHFGEGPAIIASAPGRTELGGNHTDHNHGHVLAAAVHLDCLAVAAPVDEPVVTIVSEGYDSAITVDLSDTAPRPLEEGTSEAMVRGVAHAFQRNGCGTGGFNACVSSTIPVGAGLSSSAAFEVLIGRIFNELFNHGDATRLDIARAARHAENVHFGKPCGFMDQMASSFEGILSIDFENAGNPALEHVQGGFEGSGYRLCVVDTGGSHADLTPDYAAIPEEMFAAAKALGRESGRGVGMSELLGAAGSLRESVSDRAVMRLMHFVEENERAVAQAEALAAGDMARFLKLVAESGVSSCRLLQNCYSTSRPTEQPVPLALALTDRLLGGDGACRVHGGGFAGTIQVFVPDASFVGYRAFMEEVFGNGSVIPLDIRRPVPEILRVED